jgi:hypothetical protein
MNTNVFQERVTTLRNKLLHVTHFQQYFIAHLEFLYIVTQMGWLLIKFIEYFHMIIIRFVFKYIYTYNTYSRRQNKYIYIQHL